jgi:hypothetical protein
MPIVDAVRSSGACTLASIADALNARGIRTARGGDGMCPLSRTCWLEQKIECPFYNREESGPLKSHRFSEVLINPIDGRGGLPVGVQIPTIGY